MLDLNFIENNQFFKIITLEESGVLFDEGDIDNNLYIIKKGSVSIQKYTTIDKTELKQLAVLNENAIFGEGALKNSEPKQVKIIALEKTQLYKIDAQKDIQLFIKENPEKGIELLTEIIDISNKRLLESNFLVTSNYQMSKSISEIEVFNNKNLFNIFNTFEKTIGAEYIIYLEKNPVMDEIIILKYDSRTKGRMQNIIIDLNNKIFDIEDLTKNDILLNKNNLIQELKNKNKNVGFLVIGGKNKDFNEGEKKAITSISTLIAGLIIQKQSYEEEVNIKYMED